MARAFIFQNEMDPDVRAVIDALTAIDWVKQSKVLWVETDEPKVAELLAGMDCAEEIAVAEAAPVAKPAKGHETRQTNRDAKQVERKRRSTSDRTVECKVCHKMVLAGAMCKTGECKNCRIKSLHGKKSQIEPGPQRGEYNPLTDKPDYSLVEASIERHAISKETINLAGLSGRKVG